jgi:ribosomal protein S18 acetylase RimI-like enzyme
MPTAANQFTIRTMSQDDLALAIDWAAREGWNPGLHDAVPFRAADPGGFLMGVLDGEPVAAISAVRYGEGFGFIGFYIVVPERRGRGFGLAVWQAALDRLQGRTVGLDGVVAQQDNYRRSGFELAYRNMRFEGVAGDADAGVPDAPASRILPLVPLHEVPEAGLLDYDRNFFPEPRADFLRAWIAQPGTVALGAVQDGQLVGYGVVRPCRVGWKIGPLCADSPELAEGLIAALQRRIPAGAPFFLDIPADNPAAWALVARHGMRMAFETARMYLGPAPELDLERIYGITSFELG